MNDTTPEVRLRMIEIFAGLSAQQRLEKSGRLFASGKQLSEIAVMRRDPRLEGLDLKLEVFRLMYRSGLSEQFLDEVERRARAEPPHCELLAEKSLFLKESGERPVRVV